VESVSSDADLVRAALTGDKDSLGALIQRHWPTAVFLAARVLGSAELAGDAAQEAAIAAMTGLDRLRCPDRFGPWFCGIALNVSRRWLRQLKSELPGVAVEFASPEPGPAQAAELADIAARVRAAIGLLADGQAEAVRLFYLQGLSHREVAAELGISPGAVKARLHQARAALAPRLAIVADITEGPAMTSSQEPRWVDATVTEIRRAATESGHSKHIMMLTETAGRRLLPIWIGPGEATALAVTLESTETPRPFTYKLAAGLVAAAGGEITEVRITHLTKPVFYASVIVHGVTGERAVDARPSDAVNLALASGAPIRVESALFDLAAGEEDELASYPVATAEIAAAESARLAEVHREADRPTP
jgi:RNA polymerase sigma factor (sigma-70 family)